MRLHGQTIQGIYVRDVVIPRDPGEPIALKVQAVMDFDDFDKLCPEPQPGKIIKPDGSNRLDLEDPKYKEAFSAWAEKRVFWIYCQSLSATPELEWDVVDPKNPETWPLLDKEFSDAGFSTYERALVYREIARVNCMDEEHLEASRKAFLAGQVGR